MSSSEQPGRREVAKRVFAAEFNDSTHSFTTSDEDRAPKYVLAPTGIPINRLFLVGVATTIDRVNDETIRARVVDPTGAFVIYASQYQPEARATLEELEPPVFVAVTGKANTFQPDGSDRVYTSVRPEAIAIVDRATRDQWAVATAEHTLRRIGKIAAARLGHATAASGVERALAIYDPTDSYYSELYAMCIATLELIAGEIDTISTASPALKSDREPTVTLKNLVAVGEAIDSSLEQAPTISSEAKADPVSNEADPASAISGDQFDEVEFDPEEPVLTKEERQTVESEFGTEFSSGNEFEPVDADEQTAEEVEQDSDSGDGEEPVDALMKLLTDLDEGDGVEESHLHDEASSRLGMDEAAVRSALDAALLTGRCYESASGEYRPV